jgi:CheY-like chemotaxis protein
VFPDGEVASHGNALELSKGKPAALVVDDTDDIAFLLAFIFEQEGYEVVTMNSAWFALEAAKERRFDVVVSDIGMPGMDGYDLVHALRSLPEYDCVPMVAVTGFAEYDDRQRAEAAGFNAHLKKPVDPMQLVALVNRLLTTKQ